MSTIRKALFLCVVVMMAACGGAGQDEEARSGEISQPDVLLVTFCTMRADRFGVYGGGDLTPNIDALAHEGAVFRNHYTQASFSGASFASIITGRYPSGHGIYDHPRRLGDEQVTVAEVFQQAGYATGGFLTHTYLRPKWNYQQGLEIYNGYDLGRLSIDALMSRKTGSAGDQVREALEWVGQIGDRPYFLWYQTHLSHYFPQVKPPFLLADELRAARDFKHRAEGFDDSQMMFSIDTLGVEPAERQGYLAAYEGAVARSDSLLGRLMDGLRELDRFDETVVVVTADHGETLGEKGLFAAHDSNLLEPTIRIPLVIRLPHGSRNEVLSVTRNIDLAPALADLAGSEMPEEVDGRSLLPLLVGETSDLPAFSETRPHVADWARHERYRVKEPGVAGKLRSIRRGNFKLTVFPTLRGPEIELYDLVRDPRESLNIADDLPEVARDLRRQLDEWFAAYDDDIEPLDLDPEDVESLRSLGYID